MGKRRKILTRKSGFFISISYEDSFENTKASTPGRQDRAAIVCFSDESQFQYD
jgi:hypothetical protein